MENKCKVCKEEKADDRFFGMCRICFLEWKIEEHRKRVEIEDGNDLEGLKEVGGFLGVTTEEVDNFLRMRGRK